MIAAGVARPNVRGAAEYRSDPTGNVLGRLERINSGVRSKPRGEDEAAGHVPRACEVADFAEDGCPKSRFPSKNLEARAWADGWHLNFNDALRK
jgi:hypothetical protein